MTSATQWLPQDSDTDTASDCEMYRLVRHLIQVHIMLCVMSLKIVKSMPNILINTSQSEVCVRSLVVCIIKNVRVHWKPLKSLIYPYYSLQCLT